MTTIRPIVRSGGWACMDARGSHQQTKPVPGFTELE